MIHFLVQIDNHSFYPSAKPEANYFSEVLVELKKFAALHMLMVLLKNSPEAGNSFYEIIFLNRKIKKNVDQL